MQTFSRTALGIALLSGSVFSAAASGELLVKYRPGTSPQITNATFGATTVKNFPQIGWQLVRLRNGLSVSQGKTEFLRSSSVLATEQDTPRYLRDVRPNDPLFLAPGATYSDPSEDVTPTLARARQYQHAQINMPNAWVYSLGNPSVTVAILDSGVRGTHADLVGQMRTDGYNTGGNNSDTSDPDGHGTHVAGLAAATGNNGIGGVGTGFNVRILPVRIFGSSSGSTDGILYAADHGARVINMSYGTAESFGTAAYSQAEFEACQYAFRIKDVLLVGAAGNVATNFLGYPSEYANVFNVGATNYGGGRASYSNYGPKVSVSAPGTNIVSTSSAGNSAYVVYSGTSMSAPIVAGAAALLRAYSPTSRAQDIINALTSTAVQNAPGFTVYGQVNVGAAIVKLSPPPTIDFKPTTATVAAADGTIVNGTGSSFTNAAYLSDADGVSLEVRSNYQGAAGTIAAVASDLPMTADTAKILSTRFRMKVTGASGVTMLVLMQNATTGAYESVTSTRLSATATTMDLALVKPTLLRYLKSNKTVSVIVRAINPSRLSPGGAPFRLSLDLVGLRVTTTR